MATEMELAIAENGNNDHGNELEGARPDDTGGDNI
jgi:hypothetical protein